MPRLHFEIEDTGAFRATMAGLKEKLSHPEEFYKRIAKNILLPSIKENFQVGGRPQRWASLRPKYEKWKRKQRASKRILVFHEGLEKQATSPSNVKTSNKELTIRIKGSDIWTYMTKDGPVSRRRDLAKVAAVHQLGGGNNVPARPFMVIQTQDSAEIVDELKDYVREAMPKRKKSEVIKPKRVGAIGWKGQPRDVKGRFLPKTAWRTKGAW